MDNRLCIPQDDLDCYYNGQWQMLHKMSNDSYPIDNFMKIQDQIDEYLTSVVLDTESKDNTSSKLVLLKESFFRRNDKSRFIKNIINDIKNIKSITDLSKVIKQMTEYNISSVFSLSVIKHFKYPDVYAPIIAEMSLSVESKEIYQKAESKEIYQKAETNETSQKGETNETSHNNSKKIKELTDMFNNIYDFINNDMNIKYGKKNSFARNILLFEIVFSKTLLSFHDINDPLLTHHSDTYEQFLEKFDTQDFWKIILDYLNNDNYVIYQNPESLLFLKKFLQNMTKQRLSIMKDYLVYAVMKNYGYYLSIKDEMSDIYGFIDEKYIFINLFYDTFGYYLQDIFEKKFANQEKNNQIKKMFESMKEYCINIFQKSDMFNGDTKKEALKKLETLDIVVGTSAYRVDLNEMPELSDDFYYNISIIQKFYYQKMISMIGLTVNRYNLSVNNDLFSFFVNAYYDPASNLIYVPTSITDDTFFSLSNESIENYGSLGAIIGHEIMHSFDNYGSMYDHLGHLNNWWSEEDYQKYNQELTKVKDHYATFELNGMKLNANTSLSENIADIAGLKLALRTFIHNNYPSEQLGNYPSEQKEHLKKYFKKWTNALRSLIDDNYLSYALEYDVHAPSVIRNNAPFSHMKEYYDIYDVKPSNFNYLEPEKRTSFLDI